MSIRLASFSKKRTEAEVVELSDTYFRKTLRSYLSLSVLPSPFLPICIFFFQIFLYMFTLASVTSLGIIIGMVITDYAVSDDSGLQTLVIGLLQGLAGGTLLYITFYEVLDKEKLAKLGMTGLGGCLLLILGFSLMAGLEAVGT